MHYHICESKLREVKESQEINSRVQGIILADTSFRHMLFFPVRASFDPGVPSRRDIERGE